MTNFDNYKYTVAFDFDGVIANHDDNFKPNEFGAPNQQTIEAMQFLKQNNFKIIIFTSRQDTPELRQYLKDNNVPYDEINKNSDIDNKSPKPVFDVLVDDCALNYNGENKIDLLNGITDIIRRTNT